MFLAKVALVVRKLAGPAGESLLTRWHSPEQLRAVLDRERARADRTGDRLSLLTFTPRTPESTAELPPCLARILNQRLRATDEVGWLDDQQVGVVLPNTPGPGAWRLADDVCLQVPEEVPPPICNVFCYPSEAGNPADAAEAVADLARPVEPLEVLFLRGTPLWKRAIDVAGAATGLLVAMPLLLSISAAIKLTSRGPVLFRQRRSGLGGRPFVMYKFRSMVADAEQRKQALIAANEQDGPAFKIKQDPRVTAVGQLLRCTSLDELPQLWNVLKGDMSLVGPRPLPCEETAGVRGWQRRRLDVTPGLTCLWQVSGRSRVSFVDWVRMDVRYIRSRSVMQDLKLLLRTVPAVLFGRGAH
jgi:lipopolysaccharide/colanic/teichoic acid biosynthesis glycosyltransferase